MTNKPVTLPAIIAKSTVTPDSLFLILPISEKLRPSNFSLSADSASTMCGGRATLSTAINAIGWLISHHNCGSMMPQLPGSFPSWAIDIANDTLASIKKGSGVDTMAVCTPLVAAINRAIAAHQDAAKVKAAKTSTTLRVVNVDASERKLADFEKTNNARNLVKLENWAFDHGFTMDNAAARYIDDVENVRIAHENAAAAAATAAAAAAAAAAENAAAAAAAELQSYERDTAAQIRDFYKLAASLSVTLTKGQKDKLTALSAAA